MLLNDFAQYLKTRSDDSFHVVVQNEASEEGYRTTIEDAKVCEARIVEGDSLCAKSVGMPDRTSFSHFLDGTEISQPIGFSDLVIPVVYGFTGAAIRCRFERKMATYDKETEENLYFSQSRLDPTQWKKAGIKCIDTDKRDEEVNSEIHPLQLLQIAKKSVSKRRADLEKVLVDKWIQASTSEQWLFWDGSIKDSVTARKHPRIVGIIKSHLTQYFRTDEQRKVLALRVGERSNVFQPRIREFVPVYSWYLRLHPNDHKDVYFGLIRVEAAALPSTIELADEISRWLLAERSPLALPDGRWDKMIYPIRDCEQYLRSISPSRTAIIGALAGLHLNH